MSAIRSGWWLLLAAGAVLLTPSCGGVEEGLEDPARVTAPLDPPPPCAADADCAEGSYCGGASLSCLPRLAAGLPIPTDALHSGTCADASDVCLSGLCNPVTSTCANEDGGTCTAGRHCVSDTCASGHCVPDSDGCWADADCPQARYCNRPVLTCEDDLLAGTAIPNDGLHLGTCAAAVQVCEAGLCNPNTVTCANPNGGDCTGASECASDRCVSGHCVPVADGCWADSDCLEARHCDRTTLVCRDDLLAGEALPDDGLHDGTCADAAVVCASGLCNDSTATCALADGGACTAPSQCVSDTCASGHCVAAGGGCFADADCPAPRFCNRGVLTCEDDLPAGTIIPTDGLHLGTCAAAAEVCESGLCNASSHTCALADGGACGAASECTSNTCRSAHCVPATNGCYEDADCLEARFCDRSTLTCQDDLAAGAALPDDGLHEGSCSDAAEVCASGLCNEFTTTCALLEGAVCGGPDQCTSNTCTSGHCAPATNGCFLDVDCPGVRYCDPATLTCEYDLLPGTAIPNDGLHTGTCADAAAVCASGLCNPAAITCGEPNGGDCTAANECALDTCRSGHCVPPNNGCWQDSDCIESRHCARGSLTCVDDLAAGTAIPNDGLHDGTCVEAAEVCASGLCNATSRTCGLANGQACAGPAQCESNTCSSGHCVAASNGCWADADCPGARYCQRNTLSCEDDLLAGEALPVDGLHTATCNDAAAVCASGKCNATTVTCAQANGAACSAGSECTTNVCSSGHCVPAANGCWEDSDCLEAKFCDRPALVCKDDLPAGAAIPTDGLHGGACADAFEVCASGLCNATTRTCGLPNGGACAGASGCASDRCASGHCVPALNGCWADADCPGAGYCDRGELTCQDDLPEGQAIPTDGLHAGTCADAAAVCLSGLCNTFTSTCGLPNGGVCTGESQCASNLCTSGHCVPGENSCFEDGDCAEASHCHRGALTCQDDLPAGAALPSDGLHTGDCADAAAVCLSGLCNAATRTCGLADGGVCAAARDCASNTCTSGHCVPAVNGCWADADCPAERYCDRAVLGCTDDLTAGTALPGDGLHTGVCADAVAVCASGLCNAVTRTCGLADGGTCTADSQCASNACRSGTCVAASGCFEDSDCLEAQFCDRGTLGCKPDLPAGAALPTDGLHTGDCADAAAVCASGRCNTTTRTCALANGAECSAAKACVSNTCTSEHCVPAAGCWVDTDCPEASYCDRSALTCQADQEAGTVLPEDGLHTGVCADAPAVCRSGLCNPSTVTCGLPDGSDCSAASQCASNSCLSDHCVPTVDGCWEDADCPQARHCDRDALACKDDLKAGTALVKDGLHIGACADAEAVCGSGLCNATAVTCALADGSPCSAANQCVADTCTAGVCGSGEPTPSGGCSCASGGPGTPQGLLFLALAFLALGRSRRRGAVA